MAESVRVIDENPKPGGGETAAPVSAVAPVGTEPGLYVRIVSGGGGGGSGPVTVADGADVAEGSTGDAAWVSGAGTVISLLKKIASAGGSAVSIADGADVAEGTTTDPDTATTVIGRLQKIVSLLSGVLSANVSVVNFPASQAVTGPLTDAQLRATPVPVSGTVTASGPLTDAQLRASAVPVSLAANQSVNVAQMSGVAPSLNTGVRDAGTQRVTVATNDLVPISAASLPLPAGAATEATLDARTGSLTEAAPATDTASSGLNGRLQRIAQRLTSLIALLPAALVGGRLDVNAGSWLGSTAPTVAQKTMANSLPVTLASDQSTLPAVAEGRAATLAVTATAAVNTGSTATLPAPGAGLFHYITKVELMKLYSVIGVAAGAGVIVTTTNLPGGPAFTTEQLASPAGTCTRVIQSDRATPLKSSVANTATTFVAPAQLQTIWRWNIEYFTAA